MTDYGFKTRVFSKGALSPQEQMIVAFLLDHGRITPYDAVHNFHCLRLAARISDLKRKGFDIRKQMVRVENVETGRPMSYASYYLVP